METEGEMLTKAKQDFHKHHKSEKENEKQRTEKEKARQRNP